MYCNLRTESRSVYFCPKCGRTLKIEFAKPSAKRFQRLPCRSRQSDAVERATEIAREISIAPVNKTAQWWRYPGAQLRKLIAEIDIDQNGCNCHETEVRMNRLGVDGCRREIESLASEVVKNAAKQGVTITTDMACWAIDEACRRCESANRGSPSV